MELNIQGIFTSKLIVVHDTDNLSDADSLMNNYNIRHLPVIDKNGYLCGILSRSDYVALKFVDSRLSNFNVRTLMTVPVVVVSSKTLIRDVAQLFIKKKISSVVVSDGAEAIGIITTEDLIRFLAYNVEFMNAEEPLDISALADEGWISNTTVS